MVPCATRYEMEKQFQAVYTIAKFKEVQEEFTGKVYWDVVSMSEGVSGAIYEIREDVIHDERSNKKTFFVGFQRENCDITCTCHNFEFRGIICRHCIAVLIRNDVKSVPEKYILRRWRRDVSRAHTRVAMNYAGLVSTPGQMKYEKMCERFATLANLTADDDVQSDAIIDWIDNQCKQLSTLRSSCNSNILSTHMKQFSSDCGATQSIGICSIRDPEGAKRKGAPKKLRRKSALESSSNKGKTKLSARKGKKSNVSTSGAGNATQGIEAPQHLQMQMPFSYTQLILGGNQNPQFSHQVQPTYVHPPSSGHITFNIEGLGHRDMSDAVGNDRGHVQNLNFPGGPTDAM